MQSGARQFRLAGPGKNNCLEHFLANDCTWLALGQASKRLSAADELKMHEKAEAREVDAGLASRACQDPPIGSLSRKCSNRFSASLPGTNTRSQDLAPHG